jgi:1,2-diacylglycerol-3-alpha-glucose alpha-1,2-glucosyltransferase
MIVSAMSGCDLYLFPTLEETEGIPVIEACACKCKALIRDIPVFDDWLIDGVNIYKAKDINEFEDKIKKILNKELPDLTEEAYKVAYDRRIEKVGEELKKVYKEVIKNK